MLQRALVRSIKDLAKDKPQLWMMLQKMQALYDREAAKMLGAGGPKKGKYDTTTGQAVIVGAQDPSTFADRSLLLLAAPAKHDPAQAFVVSSADKNHVLVCHQATIPSLST